MPFANMGGVITRFSQHFCQRDFFARQTITGYRGLGLKIVE